MKIVYSFIAALLYSFSVTAQCDPVVAHDTSQFTADKDVYASATNGNILYLGGAFSRLQQYTGHFAGVDTGSGNIVSRATWPKVDGPVYKAIADGTGGWIIGGKFSKVGDSVRQNMAQIDAAGHVTAFSPKPDDAVRSLLLAGSKLYIGGDFKNISGLSRDHIARVSFPSAAVAAWSPAADTSVWELVEYNGKLYAGGIFTHIGGKARTYVASIDTATGLAYAWDPATLAGGSIRTIVCHGSRVYVGGNFSVIGGMVRTNAAALDTGTALATTWDPYTDFTVAKMIFRGATIYMTGSFGSVRGAARAGFAEVDTVLGSATSFDPAYGAISFSHNFLDMAVSGDNIFIAGRNYRLTITGYYNIATFSISGGHAVPIKWVADSTIYTLGISGSKLFAGGDITRIGKERIGLAAIDMNADTITAWQPGVDGYIKSIAVGPSKVYVGGAFHYLDYKGVSSRADNLAAVDPVTGANDAGFSSLITSGAVNHILYHSGNLYVAGTFAAIGTYSRRYLGKVSAITAAPDPVWNPYFYTAGDVGALAVDEKNNIIIGGSYTTLGGSSRSNLGSVDPVTGVATSWNPSPTGTGVISALSVNNGKVFVGGSFSNVGARSVNNLAKVSLTTGLADAWTPNPDAWVNIIAPYYNTEIIGGFFTHIGTAIVSGLGSVNVMNNVPSAWNPSVAANEIKSIAVYNDRVYALGSFTNISGLGNHQKMILYRMQTIPDTISIIGANSLCPGEVANFDAATGLPGNYQWQVNGVNKGINADTFSYIPTSGDNVVCTYTITTTGGCYTTDSAISNTMTMTVNPIIKPVITLSAPVSDYVGKTVTVTAAVSGAGSSYTIYWFNNSVLFSTTTVPSTTYTKVDGTDNITAKIVPSGPGCYDSTMSSAIVVTTDYPVDHTGFNGVIEPSIHIYPIPANEALYIDDARGITGYKIYSMPGKVMQQGSIVAWDNKIMVASLSPGMYIMELTNSGGNKTIMKFVRE